MNETNELAKALALAQGSFTNPSKDRENPYFKSRYATLDALQNATRAALSQNGLSVSQGGQMLPDGTWVLRTTLLHESGQSLSSEFPLLAFPKGTQAAGSEITYMRRYAYAALLNITADEDDDANSANAATSREEAPLSARSAAFVAEPGIPNRDDSPANGDKFTGIISQVEASKDGDCVFAKINNLSVWTRDRSLMTAMVKHQNQTVTAHLRGGKKPGVYQLISFIPS